MKRFLLSFVCCCSLLFNISIVKSVDLVGPNGETRLSTEQYGPITASETLWAISTKLRPDTTVSVYQTLVAIYKLNPSAFYKGNINNIIPNSVITIPSLAFISEQKNKEAYRLLKPVSKKVAPKVIKPVAVDPVVIIEPNILALPVIDPEMFDDLKEELANREVALIGADRLIVKYEKELLLLNEQFIHVTEMNQGLKLKIQPLADQITLLSEQISEEISLQAELQALIDQYKAQIDAIVEPPFSGEGLFNELLTMITSSVGALLLTILAPFLIFIAIFVVMIRLKSKKELALQEQELAESTATLMEQSGKFDSLLTDDLDSEVQSDDNDQPEERNIDNTAEKTTSDEKPESIEDVLIDDSTEDIELDIIDEAEDLESAAQPIKEEFIDLEASEDDPFGIGALVDEEDLIVEPEPAAEADENFEIDALIAGNEEPIELSDDDLSIDNEANQADLDLAAEWESQLAESEVDLDEAVSPNTEVEEVEEVESVSTDVESESSTEAEGIDELSEGESSNAAVDDIDALLDVESASAEAEDIDALLAVESPSAEVEDIDALLAVESSSAEVEDIDALLEGESPNAAVDDIDALLDVESPIAEAEDIDALLAVESPSAEVDDIDALLAVESPSAEAEDIDALLEGESSSAAVDDIDALLDVESPSTEAEDIDALLAVESPSAEVDDIDALLAVESPSAEAEDIDALLEGESSSAAVDDIDALLAVESPSAEAEDIDALLEGESSSAAVDDIGALLDVESASAEAEDIDALLNIEPSNEEVTDLSEFENIDMSTLKNVDETISELDAADEVSNEALLTKALNENAPLPNINEIEDNGFIDIDTLLEGSNEDSVVEEEFNLDLGLDEFPDVVESFTEFDTDDNGIAAQLDLARAYLEIDEKNGAKGILTALLATAKESQLLEVKKLLNRIQ